MMEATHKADLPESLRLAMNLDPEQFQELEVNSLQAFIQFANALAELDALPDEPSEMECAFRPTYNPREQFFCVRYSMMVDPSDNGARMEVTGFKPMGRAEYIAYCIEEYGEAPMLDDPTLN
jgi:hypothetical protein